MGLVNEKAQLLTNVKVGPGLYVMSLKAPHIACNAKPGQFFHLRIPGMESHILRRPFGIYARDVDQGIIYALYQVVGFGTEHLSTLAAGEEAELIGPVGNGWHAPCALRRALIVGGGVGAAPLYMLCEQLLDAGVRTDVVLGAQSEASLVCRKRFERLLGASACADATGSGPRCATDDGSFGRVGFCTSLVEESLDAAQAEGAPYDYVAVCGPEPLMKIVAKMASEAGVFCEVSLEKRMACGIGACLSCVVNTREGKKRACVDGPVFPAKEVVW